jgi:DNA repair exonuclease SbcCD ATPase subunit
MKLTKIKLEHVRQFRAPFELANLSSGLNLFTGPNEAGKSTVVRAIRAAFFERYKTTSVDDLLPWGDSSATPTVELDFEVGSQAFHLRKCFLNKKRCELKAGDKQYDGEDAEQYLADLLGFEFAGKGSSKPEHWGIPGLLWIEQGAGQEIADSVGNATDHLRKVLDQSVGEVASTQGDAVIAKIHDERNALLTSTGRPRAVYAEAITERDALRVRVAELGDRITTYQAQVDQLGKLRDEDLTDLQSKPWELLRAQQAEAEQRLAAIETLKGHLTADELAFTQLKDKQKLIAEQLQAFDAQERDLRKRELAFAEAQSAAVAQKGVCEIRDAAREAAEIEYASANATLALSRQEDLRADLTRSAKQAQSMVATLSDTLVKAEAEQGNLVGLQKSIRDNQIEKKEITSLRDQLATLNEIRIRREVAATRLRFNLLPGQSLTLNEEVLSSVGERLVSFDTIVRIAGIGELQLLPVVRISQSWPERRANFSESIRHYWRASASLH